MTTVIVAADLWIEGVYLSPLNALRYANVPGRLHPDDDRVLDRRFRRLASRCPGPLLFLLFFVGGCAGSTGGSVKGVRIVILNKKLAADLKRLASPHAMLPVRLGKKAIPDDVVSTVVTFFTLYLTLFALGGLGLAALGSDMVTAFTASASSLGNIGPGFNMVGPAANYAGLPAASKLILVFLMIAGRLEIYPVLVLMFLSRRRPGL